MKWLSLMIALGIFGVKASDSDLPRGISLEGDIRTFKGLYCKGRCYDSYSTTELKAQCMQFVAHDSIAEKALNVFFDCKYWHLVDYCEDNLRSMDATNAQLFMEMLVLLAPHLYVGRYGHRIVELIGDSTLVTPDYFQNRDPLYNVFCCGATENTKRGYGWCMIEICASICDELQLLARMFHWKESDRFDKTYVREIAYGGRLTENHLRATATCVWPNLPDAFTERNWMK